MAKATMNTGTNFTNNLIQTNKLAQDAHGKNFTSTRPVEQWTCVCNYPNPSHSEVCKGCGEKRPERKP